MSTDDVLGQPALAFERAHGLSNIAGRYVFSDEPGMDRLSLQNKLWSAKGMNEVPQEELASIFGKLRHLNSEAIASIAFQHDDPKQIKDIVHGMVSGFNVDDINLFMRRTHGNVAQAEWWGLLNDVKAWEIKIMQRLPLKPSIEWIASETTLQNIWQQVKDKPILHSLDVSGGAVYANASKWLLGAGIAVTAAAISGYALGRSTTKKDSGFAASYLDEKSASAPKIQR